MTKPTKKSTKSKPASDVVRDWEPLFTALQDVADWILDIAVKLARGYQEDIDSIEHVREFFRAWREGRPSEILLSDVLLTTATVLSAIELDLGIESVSLLAPLNAMLEAPSSEPPTLSVPGMFRHAEPTVVIRRVPKPRKAA